MVVSGGDQAELHYIFAKRGLLSLFDRGIHGSPATKDEILSREIAAGRLELPALFLGDSRYDHEAAKHANLDFIFIQEWTEFKSYKNYCENNNITVINRISDLYKYLNFL
jgi:phosphoglycolate phosphatase-like HAD superfamily hydrolase